MLSKKDLVKANKPFFTKMKEIGFSNQKIITIIKDNFAVRCTKEVNNRVYTLEYFVKLYDNYLEVGPPYMLIRYNEIYDHLRKALPELDVRDTSRTIRHFASCGKSKVETITQLEDILLSYASVYEKELKPWSEEFSDIKRASEFLEELEEKDVDPVKCFEHQSFNNLIVLYYMINMLGGGGLYLNLIQRRYPEYFKSEKEDPDVDQEELQEEIDEYNAIYPKIDAYFKSIGQFVGVKDLEA